MSRTKSKAEKQERAKKSRLADSAALAIPVRERLVAAIPFAILVLLYAVGSFFPESRIWGANQLAFLPGWAGVSLLATGALLVSPALYRPFTALSAAVFPTVESRARWSAFLLAAAAAAVFWFLRLETYFLGDGAVYLAEHYRFVRGLPVSEDMLYSGISAPVTARILAWSAKFLYGFTSAGDAFFIDPKLAFHIWGLIAGTSVVVFTRFGLRRLLDRAEDRMAFFLALVSSAGVLFYFGYVEYYTFYFTAMALYFIALHRAIDGTLPAWRPVAILLVATGFHFMAVIAIPSLLLLLASRSGNSRLRGLVAPKPVAVMIAAVTLAGAAYYFAAGIDATGHRVILSLRPFGREGAMQSYTMLSSYHLVDVANYLVLIGGPSLVMIGTLYRRRADRSPHVVVASVNAVFFLFLALFGNFSFGMARDWDINAVLGLALVFLVMALYREREATALTRYRMYLYAGSSVAGVLIWLAVNLSPDASVARFQSIMALDDRHIAGDYALTGYEHVRKYHFSRGDMRGVLWAVRKKIECVGYPEDYRRFVQTTLQSSAPAERQENFAWAFDSIIGTLQKMRQAGADSLYAGTRVEFSELLVEVILNYYYANYAAGTGDPLLRDVLARAERLMPGDPVLAMTGAQFSWDATGAVSDPSVFARGGDAVRTSSVLSLYAGRALVFVREYARAIPVLEKSVRLDSTFTLPLLYLTVSRIQIDPATYDRPSAIASLERFVSDPEGRRLATAKETDEQLVRYAENLLRHIRGQGSP